MTKTSPSSQTEEERTYTEDEYIDYGVIQYRRGRAQAEAEAEARSTPAEPLGDVSDRDKTVENLINALAYRYDDDEEGTPCFCVTGDAVDGQGRIISHTPRCRQARMTLDRWRSTPAEALDVRAVIESFRYSRPLLTGTPEYQMWQRNEETLDALLALLSRNEEAETLSPAQ